MYTVNLVMDYIISLISAKHLKLNQITECKYLHFKREYGHIGSKCHKCKVNTAHQMELFVIWISKSQEMEMQNAGGG